MTQIFFGQPLTFPDDGVVGISSANCAISLFLGKALMIDLLEADEPAPATVREGDPASPFVIACDHAGRLIPRRLGDLGVSELERARHIAWDIGAAAVSRGLGGALNAFTILQTYSRLVIDCNRNPSVPSAFVEMSEETPVPGNVGLSEVGKAARVAAVFRPYHDRLAAELDRRRDRGLPSVLIAMHSFTPVFKGEGRPFHVGVLHAGDAGDPGFALIVRDLLAGEEGLDVRTNEPYALGLDSDYTVPIHALGRGLPYVEIEVRQDLLAESQGQAEWSERFARLLPLAWVRYREALGQA